MEESKFMLLSTNDPVTVFDYTFNGLSDIEDHVEITSTIGKRDYSGICKMPYIHYRTPAKSAQGIHVLEIYESYPCFDSSDYAYENRQYQNFFFSRTPFTMDEVDRFAFFKYGYNCELDPKEYPNLFLTEEPEEYTNLFLTEPVDSVEIFCPEFLNYEFNCELNSEEDILPPYKYMHIYYVGEGNEMKMFIHSITAL